MTEDISYPEFSDQVYENGDSDTMSKYLVISPNEIHGHIFLGEHLASNPENAVHRARENYDAENMAQELAISKDTEFKVYEINSITEVETRENEDVSL